MTGGVNPTSADLLDANGTAIVTDRFRNFNNRNDFRVLKSGISFVEPTTIWEKERKFAMRIKVNKVVQYKYTTANSAVGDHERNLLWLTFLGDYVAADAACPDIISLVWVVRFSDI